MSESTPVRTRCAHGLQRTIGPKHSKSGWKRAVSAIRFAGCRPPKLRHRRAMIGKPLEVGIGIRLWKRAIETARQRLLIADVFKRAEHALFYRPLMPLSGKPFSV